MRRFAIVVVALNLLLVVGCSQPTGRVHGVVTLKNKPVGGGTVVLLPEDNQAYRAAIGPDGKYAIGGIPYGKIRVAVFGEVPRTVPRDIPKKDVAVKDLEAARGDDEGKMAQSKVKLASEGVYIPPIYGDAEKSGLKFDLNTAEKEYPVELK